MKRLGLKSVASSLLPSCVGLLLSGCEGYAAEDDALVDPAAAPPRAAELKASVRSGLGPGSFDLDSKADLGIFSPSASPSMTIRMSTGSTFGSAVAEGTGFCGDAARLLDGDFNNDQLDDVACVEGTTVRVRLHKNPPTTPPSPPDFNAASTWLNWPGIPTNSTVLVGDFTGYFSGSSRKDDLAFIDPTTHNVYVARSTGSSFATPSQWLAGFCATGRLFAGDFDGDALEDIACFNSSNGSVRVARSSGTAFRAPTTWITSWCASGASVHVADFNGDNRDDLACVSGTGTVPSVAISNGSTFGVSGNWLTGPGFGSSAGTYYAADYNGDGRYDLGFCDKTTNGFKVSLSSGGSLAQPLQWIGSGGIDCAARIMPTGTRDNDSTSNPANLAEWTFMVYMDGDNSLEGATWYNLDQMQQAAASAQVNIIVLLDTSSTTDEFQGQCVYLKVTSGSHGAALQNLGECNMGDWHTAATFASWTISNYPAKRYAFTLWDHGGGWTKSATNRAPIRDCCVDDHPGPNGGPGVISIANGDYASLLQSMNTQIGRKVDLVGFDACLMGMWEVASASTPYANYLVASEDFEPWSGWNYDLFVPALVATPTMSAASLGAQIVSAYTSSTLSEIDLAQVANLSSAVSDLGAALLANPSQYTAVNTIRSSSDVYVINGANVDLGLLAGQLNATSTLPAAIRAAAATVTSRLSSAVLLAHNAPGAYPNATGLTIYMPAWNDHTDALYYTGAGAVWISTQWDEFLRSFAP